MSSSRPNPLERLVAPGTVVHGKYRVERVIGEGGMGIVVEAWHLDFEERVAIKFLSPQLGANEEAVARFEREARVLFKIKSPHVCRVLDVGRLDGGAPFLVLEFLEGRDLSQVLAEGQAAPLEDAIDWVVEASDAVSEAHARGIVHRDIKPENLFLAETADGNARVKVLDFGLSKIAVPSEGERVRPLTAMQQAMGTPHYMSPEQWLSARDVGSASDQWALAVILYELLAGSLPFDGGSIAQVCTAVLNAPLPPLRERAPHVPVAVEQALARALEKDPTKRFENLGNFAAAIAPYGRPESLAIASRIARMFEQADALLRSAEFARLSASAQASISESYPGARATPSQPSRPGTPPPTPSSRTGRDRAAEPDRATAPTDPALSLADTLSEADQAASQPRRHQTAQSWLKHLVERPSQPVAATRRTSAIAIGAGIAALGLVALVVAPRLFGSVDGPTMVEPEAAPAATPTAGELERERMDAPLAAEASASAVGSATAVPSSAVAPAAAIRPTSAPVLQGTPVTPVRPVAPVRPTGPGHDRLFDKR